MMIFLNIDFDFHEFLFVKNAKQILFGSEKGVKKHTIIETN